MSLRFQLCYQHSKIFVNIIVVGKFDFKILNAVLCEGSSFKDAIRKQNYQPRRPSYFISKTPEQEALEMDKSKKQRQTRIMSIQECSQV